MSRIASADEALRAFDAPGAVRCTVTPENLITILPDIHEIILSYISLHQLRSVLYIQTCADVAVAAHTCGKDPCSAQEVVVAHHTLILNAQIV